MKRLLPTLCLLALLSAPAFADGVMFPGYTPPPPPPASEPAPDDESLITDLLQFLGLIP